MSLPTLHPALQAVVDREGADIRDVLADYPAYATYLQAGFGARETGRLVAVDVLARLAEIADQSPEKQLLVAVARLHAWSEATK